MWRADKMLNARYWLSRVSAMRECSLRHCKQSLSATRYTFLHYSWINHTIFSPISALWSYAQKVLIFDFFAQYHGCGQRFCYMVWTTVVTNCMRVHLVFYYYTLVVSPLESCANTNKTPTQYHTERTSPNTHNNTESQCYIKDIQRIKKIQHKQRLEPEWSYIEVYCVTSKLLLLTTMLVDVIITGCPWMLCTCKALPSILQHWYALGVPSSSPPLARCEQARNNISWSFMIPC